MAINKKEAAAGLASAVALMSGAQVAGAADADVGPIGHDWSGMYLGVTGAFVDGDLPWHTDQDYQIDGEFTFGGFAGVNVQNDNFVFGAELALQGPVDADDGDDGDEDYGISLLGDAKLRVGTTFGSEGQILAYGFGGFSVAQIKEGSYDGDYSAFGLNAGAGLDWAFTENFSVGVEYIGRVMEAYETDGDDTAVLHQGSLRASFHF
jgi:opacity protein-like surface antigen